MAKNKQPSSQKGKQSAAPDIDPMLLSALVCPKSRAPLTYDSEAQELISKKSGLAFPIREGVPILLIEEARKL